MRMLVCMRVYVHDHVESMLVRMLVCTHTRQSKHAVGVCKQACV